MKVNLSTPNIEGKTAILSEIEKSLTSGWVSTGPVCSEFENLIKEYTGAKYAVAVSSGTAALHLSYYVAGVSIGDEVIVPTLTFIATVEPVKYLGANPIFMDCDDSLNIDIEKVKSFLEEETFQKNGECYNKTTNARIKAIVPVHIFGNVIDMDKLVDVVKPYNITIIEDAAESLGSFFEDGTHSGLKSFAGAISFNANKIITTGGGGAVITNNKEVADKIRYISQQSKDDALRFIHNELGYNYRMIDINAAIGIEQIKKLANFKKIKRDNYNYYKEKFSKYSDFLEMVPFNNENQNYWFYNLKLKSHDAYELVLELEKDQIQTRPVWYLSHNQEYLTDCQTYKIEKSEQIFPHIISIPCSTHLTLEEIDYVVEKIIEKVVKNEQ